MMIKSLIQKVASLSITVLLLLVLAIGQVGAQSYPNPQFLSTDGTTPRTIGDWLNDTVNAIGKGVSSSSPDTTATLVAACTYALAQNKILYLPTGTYLVDGADLPGCSIQGAGSGLTTIKRKNNATNVFTWRYSGVGPFSITGITFDGNKANQTVSAPDISTKSNAWGGSLSDVEVKNAKGTHGIQINDLDDLSHGTKTKLVNVNSHDNDLDGMHVHGVSVDFTIISSKFHDNTGAGFIQENNGIYPVPASSILRTDVENSYFYNNGSHGLSIGSYCGSASVTFCVSGYDSLTADQTKVIDSWAYGNKAYGFITQVNNGTVTGDWAVNNGTGTSGTFAGFLSNSANTTYSHNHAIGNDYYGQDAGGCAYCVISDNFYANNGNNTANSGIGLNIEASPYTTVANNILQNNGSSTNGDQIAIRPYGGTGTVNGSGGNIGFLFVGGNNTFSNNLMVVPDNTHFCMHAYNDVPNLGVYDNKCSGTNGNTAFWLESTSLSKHNNLTDGNFPISQAVGLTTTTISYPDNVEYEQINFNTSATATLILPTYIVQYIGSVYKITVTANGSGYVNPQVTLPCGATAQMFVTQDGKVAFGRVVNKGSGCSTGTFSVAVVDNGGAGPGTGATATYSVQPMQALIGQRLHIDFVASTPVAIVPGSFIRTDSNVTLGLIASDSIELTGYPNGTTSAYWNVQKVSKSNVATNGGGVPTNVSCGTGSPVAAAGSNSLRGTITVGGGSVTSCQFAWATPSYWAATPFCSISNLSVSGDTGSIVATTSGFTASFAASMGAGTFNYSCQP